MSSLIVRERFRARLATLPTTLYIETVNVPVSKPAEQLENWVTVSFFSDANGRINFCKNMLESGTVEAYISTPAGEGDLAGMTIGEEITKHFTEWQDLHVSVENIDAPQEMNESDQDGFFYRLVVAIHYSYRHLGV